MNKWGLFRLDCEFKQSFFWSIAWLNIIYIYRNWQFYTLQIHTEWIQTRASTQICVHCTNAHLNVQTHAKHVRHLQQPTTIIITNSNTPPPELLMSNGIVLHKYIVFSLTKCKNHINIVWTISGQKKSKIKSPFHRITRI